MSLYNGPPRPGARGGRAEFSWENVKADNDKSYYLGASVKASTGRWCKGKDIFWYNKAKSDSGVTQDELAAVKAREQEMMAEALGLKPKSAPQKMKQPSLEKHEVDKLLKGDAAAGGQEAAALEGERVQGLGFGSGAAVAVREEVHQVLQGTGMTAAPAGGPPPAGGGGGGGRGSGMMTAEQLAALDKADRRAAKKAEKKAKKKSKKSKKEKKQKHKHRHKSSSSDGSSSDSEDEQHRRQARPGQQQQQQQQHYNERSAQLDRGRSRSRSPARRHHDRQHDWQHHQYRARSRSPEQQQHSRRRHRSRSNSRDGNRSKGADRREFDDEKQQSEYNRRRRSRSRSRSRGGDISRDIRRQR